MKIWFASLALLVACTSSPAPRADPAATVTTNRTPAVSKDSRNYDLFEGTSYKNDCAQDSDCVVGGCAKEVCSAEPRVVTSCIVRQDQPRDASCGCVSGQCLWYR